MDVDGHLGAAERSVSFSERDGNPARAVILSRSYRATVEDLGDAVTSRERLPRWLAGRRRPRNRRSLPVGRQCPGASSRRANDPHASRSPGRLLIHLAHPAEPKLDDAAFAACRDGKAFIKGSSERWERAPVAAGMDPGTARAAARRTAASYTGEAVEMA